MGVAEPEYADHSSRVSVGFPSIVLRQQCPYQTAIRAQGQLLGFIKLGTFPVHPEIRPEVFLLVGGATTS